MCARNSSNTMHGVWLARAWDNDDRSRPIKLTDRAKNDCTRFWPGAEKGEKTNSKNKIKTH